MTLEFLRLRRACMRRQRLAGRNCCRRWPRLRPGLAPPSLGLRVPSSPARALAGIECGSQTVPRRRGPLAPPRPQQLRPKTVPKALQAKRVRLLRLSHPQVSPYDHSGDPGDRVKRRSLSAPPGWAPAAGIPHRYQTSPQVPSYAQSHVLSRHGEEFLYWFKARLRRAGPSACGGRRCAAAWRPFSRSATSGSPAPRHTKAAPQTRQSRTPPTSTSPHRRRRLLRYGTR